MTREAYSRGANKGSAISSSKQAKKEDKVAKLDKLTEKLIKVIKFEVEVQKSLAISTAELHKKRLSDLQRCLG